MNIAFLSFYNGLSFRGAETFVHELATRLSADFNVTVYQNGKSVISTKYSVKYLPSLQSLPEFDPHPDILIPINGRFQAFLSKVYCLSKKCKLIISGQSGPGFDDRINLYTFPDTFVGLTDYQVNWAKKVNPRVKVAKVSNGVDLNQFKPSTPPMKIDLLPPIILYVAALEQIKRHDLLIDAVSLTSASLLLVGQGSLENKITQAAKEKLSLARFKILHAPHSQMPAVYTASNLFVYPTAPWESFGIAILEAMASGLPVVATDDPIRREIVGDAGLVADPTDPTSFSEALKKALSINWENKTKKQAEKFSWDVISDQYAQLCKSL